MCHNYHYLILWAFLKVVILVLFICEKKWVGFIFSQISMILDIFVCIFPGIIRDKGQWTINWCTSPIMINKITTMEKFWHIQFVSSLNQDLTKVRHGIQALSPENFGNRNDFQSNIPFLPGILDNMYDASDIKGITPVFSWRIKETISGPNRSWPG